MLSGRKDKKTALHAAEPLSFFKNKKRLKIEPLNTSIIPQNKYKSQCLFGNKSQILPIE